MSSELTSSGHTRADSRPKAPAPQAAVKAVLVTVSPLSAWSWKSGRIPASASMVSVETAHTEITRSRVPPALRHRPSLTPFHLTSGPRVRHGPASSLS